MKFERKLKKEFIDALERFIDLDQYMDPLEKKQLLKYAVSQFELAANGKLKDSNCTLYLAASADSQYLNAFYYVLEIPSRYSSKARIGAELSHNFELVTVQG
ncbi:hypothetical protein [Turicimonas muris]|uniref:hypothetical protein n=1 Tax=Turicimonas muris TaxID=1796652 RepID=UPI002674B174|nr:hypothetical protein [Turicimonas muris]